MYGLSGKEMRVDDWGFGVVVGFIGFSWGLRWWWLISKFEKILSVQFLERKFMLTIVFFNQKN